MANVVLVKGNIIGMSGCHVVKEFCLVSEYYAEYALKVIEGDLILDEHAQTLPYCIYAATRGVSTLGIGTLQVLFRPLNIYSLYQREINKIQELMQVPIPQHLQSVQYRILYIGVVSVLEFFLTELFCSLVLGDKDYYDSFISNSQVKIPLSKLEQSAANMQKTIHKAIHDYNAHDLKKMSKLYKKVLDVSFPDYSNLASNIETRHDMVHRNGFEVSDKTIKYIDITKDRLLSLIDTCNEFVEQLWRNMQTPVRKWNEDIRLFEHGNA